MIVSVCVLLLTSLTIGGTIYAKYVHSTRSDIVAGSPNFYFESDYLTSATPTYYLKSDTKSVSFLLKNYADVLRFSDDDVAYTLTLTCLTNPTDTSATLSQSTGSIATGAPREAVITISGLKSGYSYRVEAVGSAGFRKTLSAIFTVQSTDAVLYKHLESVDEYVILTVWTRDLEGDVSISLPDGLIPDNTWPGMSSIKSTQKKIEESYEKYASKTYRFFKKDLGDDFTANDFTVKLGEIEAEIKTLS